MSRVGRWSAVGALGCSTALLVACGSEMEVPPRFSYEMYGECSLIKRALEHDYVRLAKRRFARNQNVFLYSGSTLGSGPPLYAGLHDGDWTLTEVARVAIAKGGSWGVSYPDTGCPNMEGSFQAQYAERYNRFALSLYTSK